MFEPGLPVWDGSTQAAFLERALAYVGPTQEHSLFPCGILPLQRKQLRWNASSSKPGNSAANGAELPIEQQHRG